MANTYKRSMLKSVDYYMLFIGVGLFCFGG